MCLSLDSLSKTSRKSTLLCFPPPHIIYTALYALVDSKKKKKRLIIFKLICGWAFIRIVLLNSLKYSFTPACSYPNGVGFLADETLIIVRVRIMAKLGKKLLIG